MTERHDEEDLQTAERESGQFIHAKLPHTMPEASQGHDAAMRSPQGLITSDGSAAKGSIYAPSHYRPLAQSARKRPFCRRTLFSSPSSSSHPNPTRRSTVATPLGKPSYTAPWGTTRVLLYSPSHGPTLPAGRPWDGWLPHRTLIALRLDESPGPFHLTGGNLNHASQRHDDDRFRYRL